MYEHVFSVADKFTLMVWLASAPTWNEIDFASPAVAAILLLSTSKVAAPVPFKIFTPPKVVSLEILSISKHY